MKNSQRKRVYAGSREMADAHTGEVSRAVLIEAQTQDINFIKLFLPERQGDYCMRPREMTLASIHLWDYLQIIAGDDNTAVTTTQEIADRIHYSTASISRSKDQLKKMDYIRQRGINIYMLNPDVATKVTGKKREALCENYQKLKRKV